MAIRVGLITSEFPPDIGGIETYSWELSKALGAKKELDVTVFAPYKAAGISSPSGVRIVPCIAGCSSLDWAKLRVKPIDVWHALSAEHAWIALKSKMTVVSVHGNDFLAPHVCTARPALAWPLLHRMRPFIWATFPSIWRWGTSRMLCEALPQAAAILSNSQYTADVLSANFPGCSGQVAVAGVGVSPNFFSLERGSPNSVTQLLTVARLSEPRKNVGTVIKALAQLRDRFSFEYTVVGDGPLRSELESLAIREGLKGRVHFVGKVGERDLGNFYSRADLFVLASTISPISHEGFGIVYIEAAASGVPSLAARLAGAAEAVGENWSGFFVKSADVDGVREALEKFLTGDVVFGYQDCRDFAKHYTWERVAAHCVNAYTAIVSA